MKSAGVGGGGGGGRRSEREDTGGQLLKELEALSQALYNAGGQRQQHAGPPAPSRMESWSSGSSSRSDEEPPQSPYNLGPGSRRREVITPPSPGLRLGTTTRHEQVSTAPPPRSPFLSSVSSRQDHQLPRSPYQLRARNVVDVSPKSPFLGSSTVRDGDKFASPYLGARRDSLAEPPSPQLGAVKRDGAPSPYLGTRTDQEPPPSSPYVGARSRDPEPPSSPYLGGARSRDPEPPSSPYLGGARSRDPEPPSSPYLGGARSRDPEPPSSPYLGGARSRDPEPPSSPYLGGARSRDPEPPSSPYLGAAPRRDPEPPLSPYLGAAPRRDQEPPASPYLGAKRDHLQEPSSSPYLGSRRGEQRYSPSFHGSARMEPKSPFLGTIEESGTAASPYLAVRNGFRSSSFSPGGQEVRSPHMLQQQGRSDSMPPPLRALSESFPRPPGAGGLTPLMLSSAAADAALGSPAKTRTLSIDRGFSSPVRLAAPAPSPTSYTKRSETYRLDAPRRATSLNPRQLEEQGEREEEEGQQQGYALLQPWHSQGFERNLPEVTNFPAWLEDNLQFSQKLEAPPKEKKGFWNWKPFRAIARIAQHRFHCVFSMHVHGIEGLPATMNGLRLSVSWKRKEAMTQTVPSRVFQGSAEFEETLSLKSTIYGSKSGAGDIKYEPKNFDLAVIALDIDSLVLGTHRLDLTRLLPANPEKNSTTLDDEEKRWMTSFKLAGKAKGGTLVVTFGYQLLLGKDSQQLLSSSLLSSRYMDSSPLMKPLLRSYNSLPNSPQGLSVPHHHHHHAGRSSDAQFSPAMSEPPSMDYEYMMGMEHLNLDESSEKPYMLGRNALRAYSRPESLQAFRDSGLLSSSSTIPSFFSHTTDSTLTPPTPPRFASADEQPAAATTPPQERSKQEARLQPRDDEAEEEELVQEDDDNEGGDEFVVVDRGLENGTMLQHFSSRGYGDIEAAEDMVRMDDEEQEEVDEEEICDEQQEEEDEEQIAEDPAEIGEEEEVVINVDSLTREERSRPAVGEMEISADTSQKAESREELCAGGWEEEDNSNSSPQEESLTGQDSSEEAGNGGGAAAALEILDHVEEEDRYREIPGIDDGEMQELLDVMDAHGEECGKGDERSRNVEFFLIQENESENNVARITRQQDCMQSPISILHEETTSRQGTSWAEEEEEEENDDDDDDNDEMDKREKREKSTHHNKLDETATKNREHAGLEEEEENDDDDDGEMDKREKREKREKSTHHKKLDEIATKNREHAGLEEEEAEEEVQKAKQEPKRSIILNSDDEIDLVAGEFLNLLEKEGELSAAAGLMSSDSEADSPRAQVLKQFEQEALIEGRIGLGFNLTEDSFEHSHNGSLHNNRNLEMGAPDNHAHSMNKPSSHVGNLSPSGWSSEEDLELVAIMEAAELELQKAIQMMRSKTRARALEDEETEALMNEWGLNTKVFEGSPPPTRPSKLDNYNDNSAAAALLVPPLLPMSPPPSLGRGLGPVIPVHGGGCLRSMSAVHFPGGCDEGSARLVMQVSKPLVVSSEMSSTSLDILRRMATAGMEGMAVQATMTMPLEDITGMTVDHISSQGLAALGGNSYWQGNHRNGYQALGPGESGQGIILGSEAARYGGSRYALGNQAGSGLDTYTRGSDRKPNQMANSSFNPYMSLEDLAPSAMEKIEALAMEGLKIQSEMTENDAPYSVDALSWQQEREAIKGGGGGGGGGFKVKQGGEGIGMLEGASALHLSEGGHSAVGTASDIFNNDLMSTAISLDEWMRLDAGICDEETSKSSLATVAAHNALHQNMIVMEKDEDSGKTCSRKKGGVLGINTVTLAMLIQLHDPLRDYEPVGAPMMALVQAERVMVPSSPRAKLGRCISEKGNSEEDEHSSVSPVPQQQQQFKIVDITVSGLKIDDNSTTTTGGRREVGWGNQRQQQSGSRWLVANGMSKSLKHQVLKTKAPPAPPPSLPATPAKFKVQKGETLWSISSLIHGTGAKWQEVAALNPHIRNPDVIFANTTIRTR